MNTHSLNYETDKTNTLSPIFGNVTHSQKASSTPSSCDTPTTTKFFTVSASASPPVSPPVETKKKRDMANVIQESPIQVSPRRLRNFKNLQLDLSLSPNRNIIRPISLNTSSNEDEHLSTDQDTKPFPSDAAVPIPVPPPSSFSSPPLGTSPSVPMSTSSTSSSLFRSPSLSLKSMKTSPNLNSKEASIKRRNTTQLALSIPIQPEIKNDSNVSGDVFRFQRSSSVSRRDPIPQTITHSNFSHKKNADNQTEVLSYNPNLKSYPNGPICVLKPNLFLYSEPTLDIIRQFDVVFNVAQELKDYTKELAETDPNIEYYFVPWSHTSKLSNDFPEITRILDDALNNRHKRVLIHCQCGVSRSASLIIAYYMKYFKIGYNEAYHLLKSEAPLICPNLTLIFDLMEWGQNLGYNSIPLSPNVPVVTSSTGNNNNDMNGRNANPLEVSSSINTQNPNSTTSTSNNTPIIVSPTEAATPV